MPEVWQQALRFARKAIDSGRRARSRTAWRAPNPMKYLATLTVIDTTTLEQGNGTFGEQTRVNSRECRSPDLETLAITSPTFVHVAIRGRVLNQL